MFDFMNNRNFRIFILILLDLCVVVISAYGALVLRFDLTHIEGKYLINAEKGLPVYFFITSAVMVVFKLYNRVWTYVSIKEFVSILKASFVIEGLIIGYHIFLVAPMPRSYYILQFMLLLAGFSVIRFAKVGIKLVKNSFIKENITRRAMIVGAGAAASILIKELETRGDGTRAVCAIDDNENKKNKYIYGVPIAGTRKDIPKTVKKYNIAEIIIAMPSVSSAEIRKIIRICQETKLPVKILPSISKSLTSSVLNEIRAINYEDLLGREPIVVNQKGLTDFLHGKIVMVTGGGGSIGSELCRQIIRYGPGKLIIFDIYENNAYDIQIELEGKYPDTDIETIIGSVRDYARMEMIFDKYRPEIIYHAAAHKHVPLMENSPNEAVKNNCLGTYNVASLADKYKAEDFVLISTDKAVRPTSLMGATKRICEMIVQTYAKKSELTRYASVRFGNVLGSSGSVVPLFLKQIEKGGPVTVTDKEMTRFFMTIPEAVSLVLQAGLFAKGGEIFVLDMGEPVKIYDLAENLIRMKGYAPNKDVMIEIIGLRPGEKLHEELLLSEEGLLKTENQLIFIGQPIRFNEDKFLEDLQKLIDASKANRTDIKELVAEVCDTYKITN